MDINAEQLSRLMMVSTDSIHLSEDSDNEMLGNSDSPNFDTENLLPISKENHKFRLEPAVLLLFFAVALSDSILQNQILYQACIAVFHENSTVCEPLIGVRPITNETQHIESQVQVYVSNIIMVNSIIKSFVPAVMSLFIGPWSDKFGRRPVILTISTAYVMDYTVLLLLSVIASNTEMSPWLFLLSSTCSVLCGGSCAVVTVIYSYISDVSNEKNKAIRMLVVEAFFGFGMMAGGLSSPYILAATSFELIFCVSLIVMMFTTIYIHFLVPESLSIIESESKIRAFFHLGLVKDLFRTSFKRRPEYKRAIIWLTIMSSTITRFVGDGENNIMYLFVTKTFYWSIQDYNLYKTLRSLSLVVGGIFGVIIVKKVFKCTLVFITMISYISALAESIVRAIAEYSWEMYLSVGLGFMSGVPSSLLVTILSHITPDTEVGKIFALTSTLATLAPFASAPLYTAIYDATLDSYPGVYNFISVGLYLICFILLGTIFCIQKAIGTASI